MFKRFVSTRATLLLVFMALSILSIPTSAEIDNCCFVDRLCMSNAEWVNGYWAFQNNECAAPSQQQQSSSLQSQPQPVASSEIDNCCFLDWQCASDDDWVTGYWAFQNNQCVMPTDSQPQAQPRETASEEVNNCCFIGWQCDTDEEWTSGYWAFQANQCDAPAQWQSQWQQMKQQQRNNANQQSQNSNQQRQPAQDHQPDVQLASHSFSSDSSDAQPISYIRTSDYMTESDCPVSTSDMCDRFPGSAWCYM